MGHLSPIVVLAQKSWPIKTRVKLARAISELNSHKLHSGGDATAHLISGIILASISCSRIAHGIPWWRARIC